MKHQERIAAAASAAFMRLAAMIAAAAMATTANARSLVHYFDFDTPSGSGLAYTDVDKGTSPANFTLKGSSAPRTSGAFGSTYAYYASADSTALWLGDGSASLGCGTTKGFTISFWLKTSSSHNAWTDFFGFRVGGLDYRCEYVSGSGAAFTMYYNTASAATNPTVRADENGSTDITEATPGTWKHAAFVFTPNSTNNIGTCALYIGGEKIAYINLNRAGNLQQLHIGSWVRALNGNDRKTKATNTGIDELAVFDYPATAEQIKWLAKYKPAQPANGPGRAMPVAWNFNTTNATHGALATNIGTGPQEAGHWGYDKRYIATPSTNGALGSAYSMIADNRVTWLIEDTTAGLGATAGSGYTLSYWVRANAQPRAWSDIFTYSLSGLNTRFEWGSENPSTLQLYGNISSFTFQRLVNTWQHVCLIWNTSESRIEVYLDGSKVGQTTFTTTPAASRAITRIFMGRQSLDANNAWRLSPNTAGSVNPQVYLDEFAMFNHTLSTNQIAWLGTHVPCLPPLDATNLVRTVSADGAWAGGLASWGVREWDDVGEAWANTTRTTIYPTLEDTEVEVAVALADGVVITNDTFVTPKKLVLTADGTPATPVAATLKTAADSRFAPEALEIGAGLQLTVPLYDVSVGGTLTLGTDSKIIFDVSNYDGINDVALVTDGIVLPSGESDALTHFGVTDNRFALSLSADGKTVYAKLDNVAATATWTGAGDGTSLGSAANWECRNSSGTVLADALPCDLTRVIVCSGSVALNTPAGTAIPWQYLRIEAGNATLAVDAVDWCGLGEVTIPAGVTVDLNGKKLRLLGPFSGAGTITSSAAGGELHIDVSEGSFVANPSVAFTGSLRLVKDGAGTFTAAREGQSYTGGTEVAEGTLRLGTNKFPLGAKNASVKICEGAVYDMNGCYSTSYCIYDYDIAGTFRSRTSGTGYGAGDKILGRTVVISGDARIELTNVYFASPDTSPVMFTMNGHTLTFDGSDYVGLGGFRSNDWGKWVFSDGSCIYEWLNGYGPTNVDVEVHAPALFKLKGNADIKGLVYDAASWQKNNLVAHLLVYGTYVAGLCHLPIQMCNGSTLDLSAITGSFDLTNAVANTTSFVTGGVIGDMTFQSGTAEAPSAVNVNLAGRADLRTIARSESPYVVTWPSQPANVDFVLDAATAKEGFLIVPDEKGLRLEHRMGIMILVR